MCIRDSLIIPAGVEVYEINGPYFFGIATKFEETMAQLGDRPKVRIIRMRKVPLISYTSTPAGIIRCSSHRCV